MISSAFGAVLLGLLSALFWGAADFTGGVATKRANVFGVVIGAELAGMIALTPIALLSHDQRLEGDLFWMAGFAGVCGGVGLVLLYRALADGQMSIVAPLSAVTGASIPVMVGFASDGLPQMTVIAGLGLALTAILLISWSENERTPVKYQLRQVFLPLSAGVLFGFYFVFLHRSSQESWFWPVVFTRLASVAILMCYVIITKQTVLPDRKNWLIIVLCGLLDTAGGVFYVLAGQIGRLDIAAVISSLYPASTVVLAWMILKERVSRTQLIGIFMAMAAIVLIVA